MFNWSEVHFYRSNFLQNPYFKGQLISKGNFAHYLQLKLLSGKNVRAWVSMDFTQDKFSAPIAIEKNQNPGSPLGATS